MSAYVDQDQVVKFYYGNALKDLKDFLPPEESQVPSQNSTRPSSASIIQNLESSVSNLESILGELKDSRRELSYLVHDLNRMMKKAK